MKIFNELKLPAPLSSPVVITIGNYDGVHLGHQQVLNRVKEVAKENSATPAVISFINQPGNVLHPNFKYCRLSTVLHKTRLLEKQEVELLFLLLFTTEFSMQTPREFLSGLKDIVPFSHLILGHDAALGKDRAGTKPVIQELAKEMGFQVEYTDPYSLDGTVVSSSKIRKSLGEGDLEEAQRLLGRKYSILEEVSKGSGHGKRIGFPTANIDVSKLCLPPLGVYAVHTIVEGMSVPGVANLGLAPTIRDDDKPLLEVHLFEHQDDIYGHEIEVVFEKFIRPEMQFDNIEALRKQIESDIQISKSIFKLSP